MKRHKGLAGAALAAGLLAFCQGGAMAQAVKQQAASKPGLILEIKAYKEVRTVLKGKTTVEKAPAEKAQRGDILVYSISYRNGGKTEVRGAVLGDRIPAGMVYAEGSGNTPAAELQLSADRGASFSAPPLKTIVVGPDGKKIEKPVPPESVTDIRWVLKAGVPPGGSGEVSFKVKAN